MSKLISTPREIKTQQIDRSSAFTLTNAVRPFDNSIYDSNQIFHSSSKDSSIHRTTPRTKRT